ncbi:MAG: AAA family ATPase [Thermoplasmata archaeon]|nr:AAA family ATPase [Thermoplasmata archaeon]
MRAIEESKEDEDVQRLKEEYEEELVSTKRRYEREVASLKFEVQRKEDKLEILEDTIQKVKKPPLLCAYVIRLAGGDLSEGNVVVARGNDILKVSVGIVDKENLKLGQFVWVHPQTYAIVEISGERHKGVIARIHDIIGETLVISVDGDMEKRLIKCSPDMVSNIKPGYQLSILPPTMEILEIIPNIDVNTLLLGENPNVKYDDIGGLSEAIERVKDVIVLPYKEKSLFDKIKLTAPRGLLLYGPPGCGKTLLVKAVATETDMTFFNISIADILSKWVGESERILKEIFRQAKERKPSIVFFDEIEAIFTTRGLLDSSGVHKNIIAQILSEMDGIVGLEDVFVIGATNRPDLLDPALLRPGRFDEIIEIPRPNEEGAEDIVKIYLTDDLPVDEEYMKEHADAKTAIAALRKYFIDEIYGDDKWIKIKVDEEAKKEIKTVKRKDIISGALIDAIIKTAKKNFIKRTLGTKDRKGGLLPDDLASAIEEECKEHAITEIYVFEMRQKEALRNVDLKSDPMVS